MKRLSVIRGFIVCFVVVASALATTTIFSRPASALLLPQLVASSNPPCSLPDGSQGVYMSDGLTCCPSGAQNSASACLFEKYINPAIQLLAVCVGLIVVIAIIVGAIEYITSAGDPQKASSGKKRITGALIGLVAFLLIYAFLQFIIPGGIV